MPITTLSLPDQSPKARKGHKTSDNNSIAVKFSDKISEIWQSSMTDDTDSKGQFPSGEHKH